MSDDTGDLSLTDGTDLTVETLAQVETSGPELPSPAQVTNAELPVLVAGKGGIALRGRSDEAANRVGIQTKEKRDEKVVSVPKRLERLLSDAVMGAGIH